MKIDITSGTKKVKNTKKKTTSGTKKEIVTNTLWEKKPKYEITKEIDVKRLKEPDVYVYKNQDKLNQKFLDEYKGFFDFFRTSTGFLQSEYFRKLVMSEEFKMHYNNLTSLMRSQDKIKSGQSEQEQQAIRIMTDYQNMMLWLDKLVMDLPESTRNAMRTMLEPNIALIKSVIKMLKAVNPELAKMRMFDSYLDRDSTNSGFSTI